MKFNIKPNIENIEKLKQDDPNFLKKFDHSSDAAADLDLEEEINIDDNDNQDVVVIDVNLSDAKQSSFIHKSWLEKNALLCLIVIFLISKYSFYYTKFVKPLDIPVNNTDKNSNDKDEWTKIYF